MESATNIHGTFGASQSMDNFNEDDGRNAIAVAEPTEQVASPNKKRKVFLIAAGALALAAAAGAGWFFAGPLIEDRVEASEYIEVPAMLISIRSADGKPRFLKVRMVLEASPGAGAIIEPRMPAVIDAMQQFLREIRPEDLNGASAMFRLKEEMLVRARHSLGSGQIKDVLIQELVQQ